MTQYLLGEKRRKQYEWDRQDQREEERRKKKRRGKGGGDKTRGRLGLGFLIQYS